MRLRYTRTIKCICWIIITASLVMKAKNTLNNYSKMAADDASLNTTLNKSFFETGSEVKIKADVSRFEPPSMPPIYHVNFLKVHKAGSTTMQNLMFRFGIRHNLTILLPRGGNYLFGRSPMPLKSGSHYDIFACHTVYSKRVFGLLPEDTVSVAIIRDPLERAISAAYYYRDVFGTAYLKRIPRETFIENLIGSPEKYDGAAFSYTKNSMGKDFGFSPGMQNSDDKIKSHLDYLQKEFRIVMVMERFEESLVLLRRSLGWSIEDIVFLQSNSHHHKPANLSEEQRSKFKQTCKLDYAIYHTFYPIFEAKVLAEGPGFQEEVTHFEAVLANVKEFCKSAQTTLVTALQVPASTWNQPFEVTTRDCGLMTKDEINFIKELRVRHNEMQNKS